MKRREFMACTAGLMGSVLPVIGRAEDKPCPPDRLQAVGGTSISTTCSAAPLGDTYLAQQASTMSAGDWKQITTGGLSTALFDTGANNTLGYMDKGAYDPINKRIRFIGNGHLEQLRWHQYDETANTWSNLAPPSWYGGGAVYEHGYQHNTVDPATGDFFYRNFNSSSIRRFVHASGTWVTISSSNDNIAGGIEWLPSLGTQGGLVQYLAPYIRTWDKATNAVTLRSSSSGASTYHCCAVRNFANNTIYVGGGNGSSSVWSVNGAGTVGSLPSCPISFGIGSTVTTACPVSGDLIVIRNNSSAYGLSGASWGALSMTGAPGFGTVQAGSHIVAVPIPAYGVILFLFGNTPATWLYKHA